MSTNTLEELRVMLEDALDEIRSQQPDLARITISEVLGKIEAAEFMESLKVVAEYRGKK